MTEIPDLLETPRLLLRPAGEVHAAAVLAYCENNRAHLAPWEPLRASSYYTLEATAQRLRDAGEQMAAGQALHWLVFARETDALIAQASFTDIARGVFQACYLGFSIARSHQGKGLMQEALGVAIEDAFTREGLHRVMASHRPENLRSAALLARLGFEREGFARAYLKIAGEWADHVLLAKINPVEG